MHVGLIDNGKFYRVRHKGEDVRGLVVNLATDGRVTVRLPDPETKSYTRASNCDEVEVRSHDVLGLWNEDGVL